jgi:hypothetical protein
MRQLALPLICSAALLAAACDNEHGNDPRPPEGAMTVDPQKIVSQAGSIRTLHGEFSIRPAKPNERFLSPATIGGACLMAHVPVEGKSCTKAADCDIAFPTQAKWTGYCLGADNLPTTQGGTCWVKPVDAKYCLKRVGPGDYQTPVTDTSAVYDYVAQQSPQWNRPINWLLLGCLNGPITPPLAPCANGPGKLIDVASQVRPVP